MGKKTKNVGENIMNSIEVSAKNVDQAIEIGLFKLNAKKEDVQVAVLSEGGLFDKAKVRLVLKSDLAEMTEVEIKVQEFVQKMGLDIVATVKEEDDVILVDFAGNDVGSVIGKRGDTLDATEHLLNQIINKHKPHDQYKRVRLDCSGYREKREGTLKVLAHRLADKSVKERKPSKLEPMNAYERKIIHLALESRQDVKTISRDAEPHRYITIIPSNMDERYNRDFND